MGLDGKESTLYMIDFGLARRYRYRENRALTHIPFRRGRSFIGTAKYASLNSHKNIELSRRDDVESLAYVLIELINGHLPWKNISKRNATTRHQTSIRIRTLKEQTNWEEFCPSMAKFIRYCREIPFNEEPDYDRLLDLLQLITVIPTEYVSTANNANANCAKLASSSIVPTTTTTARSCVTEKMGPLATSSSSVREMCCQTPATAEKMTQVDFEATKIKEEREEDDHQLEMRDKKSIEDENMESSSISITRVVTSTIQRLSLKVASSEAATNCASAAGVGSDADDVGAATTTTTTSCSENELLMLDSAGGDCLGDRSSANGEICSIGPAVSDGDDELTADSQPAPQQDHQPPPVCRKCRRLRDQQNQHNKRSQLQQRQQQQQTTAAVDAVSPQKMEKQQSLHQQQQTEQKLHQLLMPMPSSQQRKMCWQQARDSNPERRFQYENRFSWTVDKQHQQPQHVQAVQIQQQEHMAPFYKLRAGAALPIGVPQIPQHYHQQQQQQQNFVAPPQFIVQHHQQQHQQQKQAYCTNGQIPASHPPAFGIPMPNSAPTVSPAAAAATVVRLPFSPTQMAQHYHQNNMNNNNNCNNNVVHQRQLLPAADPSATAHPHHFLLLPPAPPPPLPVASVQCQAPIAANFGPTTNLSCAALQQPSLAPPPGIIAAQPQQQQKKRVMHLAFVLPPPTPTEAAGVGTAPPATTDNDGSGRPVIASEQRN